jgi:hypothetical protein
MKKVITTLVVIGLTVSLSAPSYASDWDKAGKALAIIEGARILTGGNVDIIGNITGINRNRGNQGFLGGYNQCRPQRSYSRTYASAPQRVWVPHYVWRKKYIPEHEEYSPEYGTIIVEGHYIKYQAEDGGHWEY